MLPGAGQHSCPRHAYFIAAYGTRALESHRFSRTPGSDPTLTPTSSHKIAVAMKRVIG